MRKSEKGYVCVRLKILNLIPELTTRNVGCKKKQENQHRVINLLGVTDM